MSEAQFDLETAQKLAEAYEQKRCDGRTAKLSIADGVAMLSALTEVLHRTISFDPKVVPAEPAEPEEPEESEERSGCEIIYDLLEKNNDEYLTVRGKLLG